MLSPSTALVLLLSSASTLVSAAGGHSSSNSHKALAARKAGLLAHERAMEQSVIPPSGAALRKRDAEKRCKVKPPTVEAHVVATSSAAAAATTTTSETAWVAPTTTKEEKVAATSQAAVLVVAPPQDTTTTAWSEPSTTAAPPPAATTTKKASGGGGGGGGSNNNGGNILAINDPTCGWSDASENTSNEAGPNGKESWITCGVNSGGWTPPYVHLNELKAADLATVLASGTSPFGPCAPYIDQMYSVGAEFGVPPILVASFAMQESTCNPHAVGGGGEQGMFQISQDKCGGAPGGNCQDVTYNMRTAMKYFSDTVAGNGGDAFLSMGMYNGWSRGMTFASATAAQWGGCCRCQNNLDYLHQLVNGWMQGHNGANFGTYFNLRVC